MKTKYVFLFDPADVPYEMERCYIFSNIPDADSFFLSKGFYLYSSNTSFTIKTDTNIIWKGDIIEGKYF